MAAQFAVGGNRVNTLHANRIGGAQHGGDVVGLVNVLSQHRKIRLSPGETLLEFPKAIGCHTPTLCYGRLPVFQKEIEITTRGRGSYDITAQVAQALSDSQVSVGLAHVFLRHTSASLMICENADPAVRGDLETFMADLVPDGDPRYRHTAEGPDDMPAHVRSVLTHTDVTVPVTSGRLGLGTWQGIYLWEHRTSTQRRRVLVTVRD